MNTWPHNECDLDKEHCGIYFIAFKRWKHKSKVFLHWFVKQLLSSSLGSGDDPIFERQSGALATPQISELGLHFDTSLS